MTNQDFIEAFFYCDFEKSINEKVLDDIYYAVPKPRLRKYVEQLLSIPYQDFLYFLIGWDFTPIDSGDITQISSFSAAEIEMCEALLSFDNLGLTYEEIGQLFPQYCQSHTPAALKKYGENQVKTSKQLGLTFCYYGKWFLNCLGYIYSELSEENRRSLLARTILRDPLYGSIIKDLIFQDVYLEKLMSGLSLSTIKRRSGGVLKILQLAYEEALKNGISLNNCYPPKKGESIHRKKVVLGSSSAVHNQYILHIQSKKITALAHFVDGSFTILKGSEAIKNHGASLVKPEKRNAKLAANAHIEGDVWVLDNDISFSSPSTASSFLYGRSSNGMLDWVDENGIPLKQLYNREQSSQKVKEADVMAEKEPTTKKVESSITTEASHPKEPLFLFRKKVDKSFKTHGFTLTKKTYPYIPKIVGQNVERGSSKKVVIVINDFHFLARLNHIGFSSNQNECYQLYWIRESGIIEFINDFLAAHDCSEIDIYGEIGMSAFILKPIVNSIADTNKFSEKEITKKEKTKIYEKSNSSSLMVAESSMGYVEKRGESKDSSVLKVDDVIEHQSSINDNGKQSKTRQLKNPETKEKGLRTVRYVLVDKPSQSTKKISKDLNTVTKQNNPAIVDNPEVALFKNEFSTMRTADSMKVSDRYVSLDAPFVDGEGNSLLDVLPHEDSPMADSSLNQESLLEEVNHALEQLNPRERDILKMFFGIGCQEMTLGEIGVKFDLTRERVRQIKEKAICRLRSKLSKAF